MPNSRLCAQSICSITWSYQSWLSYASRRRKPVPGVRAVLGLSVYVGVLIPCPSGLGPTGRRGGAGRRAVGGCGVRLTPRTPTSCRRDGWAPETAMPIADAAHDPGPDDA